MHFILSLKHEQMLTLVKGVTVSDLMVEFTVTLTLIV